MKKFIDIIAGARPNFMKIAPIINKITSEKSTKFGYRLIHTGQHFDKNLSETFFEQLKIPKPNVNLDVKGGTHAEQTARIIVEYEKYILSNKVLPNLCLVVGDVNSTMACAIVAKKLNIKVAHVEAGIRSFDLEMPEEINRMVTDSISDYFFTTSEIANSNLIKEGHSPEKILFVGNTMIDTLVKNYNSFKKPIEWEQNNLKKQNYFLMTLHRPSNVDDPKKLNKILSTISKVSKNCKVIFPVHPRTKKSLNKLNLDEKNLITIIPLIYLEFNYLVKNSLGVITDSGGITEETSFMNIPCITLRDSTERPETITLGTNELVQNDFLKIENCLKKIINGKWKQSKKIPLWDGNTSSRIIENLKLILQS